METSNLTFYQLGLAPKMLTVLDRMKFVKPTPIQHKSIPIALQGSDIVGIAQTGTGKTLAFGIPSVQRLTAEKKGAAALVLVPTRELALQVDEALRRVLHSFGMNSAVLIGGASYGLQEKALRKKPEFIVATPGRLIDHLEQKTIRLTSIKILILDEADRMFDMGFAPQVERIIRQTPKERQTLLFSATMPPGIVGLATRHMKLPINVEIAPSGTSSENVSQELFILKEESKKKMVKFLLEAYKGSVLLFTRTKIKAKRVTRVLRDANYKAVEIHSDRTMAQRKRAIEGFKSGAYRILVATDIAARGIDVTGIELVINYDLPEDSENYVHRIGRTGRAGHEGHAISLATPDQGSEVGSIERFIKKTIPVAEHPEFPKEEFKSKAPKSSTGYSKWKGLSFKKGKRSRGGGGRRRR